jgi:hypothetical protein
MYTLDILYNIQPYQNFEHLDLEEASWGMEHPENVKLPLDVIGSTVDRLEHVFYSNKVQTWPQFMSHVKAFMFTSLQSPIDISSSRWILRQFVMIIGYYLKSSVKITSSDSLKAHKLVSCVIKNHKEIMDDPKFLQRLRELQILLEQPKHVIEIITEPPESLNSRKLLTLSNKFSKLSMSKHQTSLLKQIFIKSNLYKIPIKQKQEILDCCKYLNSIEDFKDLYDSRRWFRISPSEIQKRDLIGVGFYGYPRNELDSVLVANYVKILIKSIGEVYNDYLIPELVKLLLYELLEDKEGGVC